MTDRKQKREEYHRRIRRALLDGGRPPSQDTWDAYLEKARAVAARRRERLRSEFQAIEESRSCTPMEQFEFLPPWYVAVHVDTVLGLEVEMNDLRETLDRVDEHRTDLLALISKAAVKPASGELDLFQLERALNGEDSLHRDANDHLVEVVRELIRWRAAAGAK